jgi:hypothetical protein
MSGNTDIQEMAKALYVSDRWKGEIAEPDGALKPQAEYERRAAESWDRGTAGRSHYQLYVRQAEALAAAGFGRSADPDATRAIAVQALLDAAAAAEECTPEDMNAFHIDQADVGPFLRARALAFPLPVAGD